MPDRPFELVITRDAQKEIASLGPRIGEQVLRATDRLLERYQAGERPQDMKPIRGIPGNFRIDSGEYRILYRVAGTVITVWRVRHRRDSYRNL